MTHRVEVEGGISINGWLLLLFSIVVSLTFTLIHPNEIIYLFGIIFIGAFFAALVPCVGVTKKKVVEVPRNMDFLKSVKEIKSDERCKYHERET
jgi:hypothetical protein